MAGSARRIAGAAAGLLALVAMVAALVELRAARDGVVERQVAVGTIPVSVFRADAGSPGPAVVIAHGFAGSRQLMLSFALTLARNGYVAVTFDFAGHGRNPAPLAGSITETNGATRTLLAETARVADYARGLGDGRIAVLGHSMASDIVVRYAQAAPDVAATVAVSMFSPAVTATSPRNLLVVVGDWEGGLKREALRAVGLAIAPEAAEPGRTYGDPAAGTGRRAAFAAHVEHASVLYSAAAQREAVDWLDRSFGIDRTSPPVLDGRGPWILAYLFGAVLLARQLAPFLPRVAVPARGAGLAWRGLWLPLLVPAVATPLVLRVVPTHFLPVLVADYLVAHFALYGLLTAGCLLVLARRRRAPPPTAPLHLGAFAVAAAAVAGYGFVALVWPIDTFVTAFVPGAERIPLLLVMLGGTLAYFLADEWMTRGVGAARGAYPAAKLAFVASLGLAVALDFQRLFFLVIIVPVIVLFFVVYGLFSGWTYRATGHPFVAALANALAFASAIAVTFPLLAG